MLLYFGNFRTGGTGGLIVKARAVNMESHGSSTTSVRALFSFSLFNLNVLSSTPSNEEMFHNILRMGCEAVGSMGSDLISLSLFQTLIRHYYSGKPKKKKKTLKKNKHPVACFKDSLVLRLRLTVWLTRARVVNFP